jgi:hypothetical protein
MELDAVKAALVVHGCRKRGAGGVADDAEALRQRSTRSPWLIQTWWRSPGDHSPSNKGHSSAISTKARTEFGMVAVDHLPAKLLGHELLAVADAEHRHAGLEQERPARAGCPQW